MSRKYVFLLWNERYRQYFTLICLEFPCESHLTKSSNYLLWYSRIFEKWKGESIRSWCFRPLKRKDHPPDFLWYEFSFQLIKFNPIPAIQYILVDRKLGCKWGAKKIFVGGKWSLRAIASWLLYPTPSSTREAKKKKKSFFTYWMPLYENMRCSLSPSLNQVTFYLCFQ